MVPTIKMTPTPANGTRVMVPTASAVSANSSTVVHASGARFACHAVVLMSGAAT